MTDEAKQKAAAVLANEIWEILHDCEKANTVLNEVMEDYFYKRPNPRAQRWEITWDFQKYSIMADIAYDYIYKTLNAIKSLDDLATTPKEVSHHDESAS